MKAYDEFHNKIVKIVEKYRGDDTQNRPLAVYIMMMMEDFIWDGAYRWASKEFKDEYMATKWKHEDDLAEDIARNMLLYWAGVVDDISDIEEPGKAIV